MTAKWAVLGANERLAFIGAAVGIGSYVLGIILASWSLGLPSLLFLVAAVGVAVMVVLGASALTGQARVVLLRIAAATALAYSALDIGDLLGSIGQWSALTIILSLAAVVGAGLMVFAAWRLTNGNIVKDATGVVGVISRPMPDRLFVLGALAVYLALIVLRIANAPFSDREALVVLALIVSLTVFWIASSPAAGIKLPVPTNLVLVALAAVVAVLALLYLVNIGDLRNAGILFWPGLLLYLGGAGALVAGAIMRFQAPKAPARA
jgi:hypothetical protein